ncbi:oocyte zinc finger protein XlCOF7.1-like [Cyclopterus lumpus]|uniref:C2H2-type domain-containing protein n=1 Tax=Cyclopterus lumpus TaxID=8103 RepID=A0A8C2WV53_CYCLU|nr:oocyte zinc finger protein XlCOF7.1-like [Cyclopterus lumpus]
MKRSKVLDVVLKADMELRREADVQQRLVVQEEGPPEQQDWSSSLDQEDPEPPHIKEDQEDPVPPHIKEEQEELWISQEGEQLHGLEEAGIRFSFTPLKSEEEAQSSHLHHRLTEDMETEGDGEDCGGPEPDRKSDPHRRLEPDTETSDSSESEPEEDWTDPERKLFHCSVCAKTFKQRGNLNIHMRTHTGVKPFSCSVCSKRFTQKAGLDYHLKIHTGEKPFSCSICGKSFRHKGAVTSHMATHTGVKPFSCGVCNKRFRATSQLKVHKCVGEYSRRHRGQEDERHKPLSCSECDVMFPNNYLLVTHMRMHKGKKLFTCSICGQKRQFSSHLEIHMRTHTGEKPFSCSVCGKRFSQRGIMSQHMAVHSGVKPFSCTVCGRRFFWHFQIKKHKCLGELSQFRGTGFNGEDCGEPDRNLHAEPDKETEPYSEPDDSVDVEFWKETRKHQSGFTYQRNKKVSVNDGLNSKKPFSCSDDTTESEPKTDDRVDGDPPPSGPKHLNGEEVSVRDTGLNTDMKPFSSSECQERSEDRLTLLTHKGPPTEEKPFRCLFCGKGFATAGYLSRHISVHTGEKPLGCIVCQERFSLESHLVSHECVGESSQLHDDDALVGIPQSGGGLNPKHQLQVPVRLHTGLKPFGCSVCGRTFAERESLQSHMTCHSGEKPFRCSLCNTGCSDSESLVQHMRIHARQTQFSCTVCGKEFAWRRHLEKHLEVHSRDKVYSCRYCDQRFSWHYQLKYHICVGHRSSQLHHTEENREAEPPASSSTEHMETEADGEDCGGPEPDRNSGPDDKTQDFSEPETDDSADSDFWEESCGRLSGLNSLSDETFTNHHRRSHTGGELSTEGGSLSGHMDPEPPHMEDQEDPEPPHIKEDQEDPEPPHIKGDQEDPEPPHIKEDQEDPEPPHIKGDQEDPEPPHIKEDQEDPDPPHIKGDQEDPVPPHIKEEQEELWTSQEGEQLQGLEEAGIRFSFTTVKSEDDEEEAQSSHLHQRQTEQMETEADGEDCGGPEPDRNPDRHLEPDRKSDPEPDRKSDPEPDRKSDPEPDTNDSVDSDFWKETREPQSVLNSLKHNQVSDAIMGCHSVNKDVGMSECLEPDSDDSVDSDFWKDNRKSSLNSLNSNEVPECETRYIVTKPYSCTECGKRFHHDYNLKNHMKYHTGEKAFFCSVCGLKCLYKSHLEIHMRTHTREKPFPCPVCGKKYAHKASMQSHMAVHTVENQYSCSVCGKGFAWFTELKYHQCVGESSLCSDWTETA